MLDKRILIVEDEAIVALEIQDRLMTMGYQVCGIAPSGEKAIALAGASVPALILMDIKLKGKLNGIETAKIIKEKLDIPFIFITAFSDESTLEQIKKIYHYEYLLKPFEEDELKAAIERMFKQQSFPSVN